MTVVLPVRPEKRAVIPAVTHFDGTGRLQTVERETNGRFHALVEAFDAIDGRARGAQYFVQPRGRADRLHAGRRGFHLPAQRPRRPGRRRLPVPETRTLNRTLRLAVAPGRRVALLVAATLLAYVPAMRGGYVWDDDAFVTNNPVLRQGWEGLRRIWFVFRATEQYYPLAYSSFWLEFHAWGLNPTGSHVVNVVLHAANALLLWRVLTVLRVRGAALAAFVFALHPVEVESVGWITERKNVLSAFFYLLAALAYFRFEPPQATRCDRIGPARTWPFYALALGFFLLRALEQDRDLLAAGGVADRPLVAARTPRAGGRWRRCVPLFAVGAGLGLLTAWMEKHVIGAKGNDWTIPPPHRLLVAGRALWFYLGKLAWPTHLAFFYPRWNLDAHVWWQWLYPAAAVAAGAALWLARGRMGRGPLAAALFFTATLFPALGFFDVYPFRYSFVADHFQYLASIGPIALAAAGAAGAARRFLPRHRVILMTLAGASLGVLGCLTWRQGGMYADLRTFYLTALERNPASWLAHDNLSQVYMHDGQTGRGHRAHPPGARAQARRPGSPRQPRQRAVGERPLRGGCEPIRNGARRAA